MNAAAYTPIVVMAYLIGSVPTAFIIARLAGGIDIRKHGSGNAGATNVFRTVGKAAGTACFLCDAGKGLAAVILAGALFPATGLPGELLAFAAVVAGHNWPVFLGFRGGKGMATMIGGFLGIAPWVVLSCILLWLLVVTLSRYVSLGSIAAAAAIPLFLWLYGHGAVLIVFGALLGILAVIRHRSNIKRLLSGTENKIGQKIIAKKQDTRNNNQTIPNDQ
ncbi:MAG: glycerol-3-phosphate 1-O-acyltransferase PlsY [Candidatus Tritonobacter lacicola]|nr:glycerol-3-phosphate 1-O-acyltransferase PlsY [Candidatus Tritonobacter lacicola]